MRRHLAADMPLIMRVYGIRPWELPQLTGYEVKALAVDLQALKRRAADG